MAIYYKCVAIPLNLQEKVLLEMVRYNESLCIQKKGHDEGILPDAFEGDYNITAEWIVPGSIDREYMERCFNELIRAHPNVCAVYTPEGKLIKNVPWQKIGNTVPDKITFDTNSPPLIGLWMQDVEGGIFLKMSVHHLAADGASAADLLCELMSRYSLRPLFPLLSRFKPTKWLVPKPRPSTEKLGEIAVKQQEVLNGPKFPENLEQLFKLLATSPIESPVLDTCTTDRFNILKSDVMARIKETGLRKLSITNFFLYAFLLSVNQLTEKQPLCRVLRRNPTGISEYSATAFLATLMGCSTLSELHSKMFELRQLLMRTEFLDRLTAEELVRRYNDLEKGNLTVSMELNYLTEAMTSPPPPIFCLALRHYLPSLLQSRFPEVRGDVNLGSWHYVDEAGAPIYDPKLVITIRDNGTTCEVTVQSKYSDVSADALSKALQEHVVVPVTQKLSKKLVVFAWGILLVPAIYFHRK